MEVYRGIEDLPIYNFDKINETMDLTLLYIKKPDKKKLLPLAKLERIWASIYDEFIQEFGESDYYRSYIDTVKAMVLYLKKAWVDGDRTALNFARIKEKEAEEILRMSKGTTASYGYAVVSRSLGFAINPKTTSVKEYYYYIKACANNPKRNGQED